MAKRKWKCDGYHKYGKDKVCRKGCVLETTLDLPALCVEYTEYYQGGKADGAATFCEANWTLIEQSK